MPFRSIFCIEYSNVDMVRNAYEDPDTTTRVSATGVYKTLYTTASSSARRELQGESSTTANWKYKQEMTASFTTDWYLTQSFGLYCGYTRQISFLVNSDYKKKDCLLQIQLSSCSTSDAGYAKYSVETMMSKVKTAFNIADSDKISPLFIYVQANGQKALETDITKLSFTATLSTNELTCALANYPTSIRIVLSASNGIVDAARLMIYIGTVS